jgi:glutamate/aspartate transport system substrate-binding protein
MKNQWAVALFVMLFGGLANGQSHDTVAKVKASGEISMGVRESSGALSYEVGDGKFGGFHVELCQRIISNLEGLVGKRLQTKYVPVTAANRIPMIQNGTIDMECGSTTNNESRQKQVAFASTTYVDEGRIAVRANSGINSIDQLNGRNVAVTAGTTTVQHLRKHERATKVDFKEIFTKDNDESFALLESGHADAFVMNGQVLAGQIANSKKPADFRIVGEVLNVEPLAIMLRRDDPAFKKLADDTIAGLSKSGELAKLYDKWFLQPIPPKNIKLGLAASEATKDAWRNLSDKPAEAYAKK